MGFRVTDVEGNELLFVPIASGELKITSTDLGGDPQEAVFRYGVDGSHVEVKLPAAEAAAPPAPSMASEPESEPASSDTAIASSDAPMVGALVHYRLPSGETRPAIVVRSFPGDPERRANLVVFLDGANDATSTGENDGLSYRDDLTGWVTSAPYSETAEYGTWRYILQPA